MARYCDHGREAATCLLCRRDRDQEREEMVNASPEIARLRAALAEAEGRHRWNVDDDSKVITLCRGDEKHERCRTLRVVPEAILAEAEQERDEARERADRVEQKWFNDGVATRALVQQLVEALRARPCHTIQLVTGLCKQCDALAAAEKVMKP